MERWVLRAPNHLGDGVMALPLVEALHAAAGDGLEVRAPRWGADLYGPLGVRVRPARQAFDGDVALLCPPSIRTVWEARRVGRRVGVSRPGVTDPVSNDGHQRDVYARLGQVLDVAVHGAPRWRGSAVPVDVPEGHLALNPLSATPATREWDGFAALALRWPGPVVLYGGPGEEQRLQDVARGLPVRCGLPLGALAGALARAAVLVSVDTGPAHFARAVGVPTVVLHGSTDPARSGPHGSVPVEGSAPCRPCHRSTCRPVGCGPRSCLAIDVTRVLAAAQGVAR